MQSYKILITSILGKRGDIVQLEHTRQTQERLDKGIIAELKIDEPTESKSKKKNKK